MRLFANANFDFIGRRKVAYVLSGAAVVIALVGALFFQFSQGSWLNYGVDFTGGTLVQVAFVDETSVAEVREVIARVAPGAEVTRFGEASEFLIRAQEFSEAGGNTSERIVEVLAERFGADGFTVARTEAVGPKVGSELQVRAALAILLSFAVTLVYLAFRFEWRFGLAAVIAVVHDILITLGILSVFRMEVSLPTVAAVLTIVGYSLNDTIIVFDRARENLKKTGRRETFGAILNRSINETLPRTVLTSGTTLATLLSLFMLGGETIRQFSLILFVGILIGTYSSIFVASPALLVITERWKPKTSGKKATTRPSRAGAAV
ncbi:MAG TPA: protein translocase subunit SecF [Longimicrobiales bacterium]